MQRVDHTDRVLLQANYTQKLLLDMETGLRGYLLWNDPTFLEPYQQANTVIAANFEKLKNLVSDNPNQTISRALQIIDCNAKLQHNLIEDLLDVSRIIQNQINISRQPVDLVPIKRLLGYRKPQHSISQSSFSTIYRK